MLHHTHINMEWCNQSTSIKYLFKYIHKEYDKITVVIVPNDQQGVSNTQPTDEIKQYLDCRYIYPLQLIIAKYDNFFSFKGCYCFIIIPT